MTVHRSPSIATPELYARASLMVDGARMPLKTVADSLGVPEDRLAQYVALGRLRAAERVVVLPKGCGPHLAGIVTGSSTSMLHLLGCETCRELEESMEEGIRVARARWTGQPLDEPAPPAAAEPAAPVPPDVAAQPAPAPPAPAPRAAAPVPLVLWAAPVVTRWAPPAAPVREVPLPPAGAAHRAAAIPAVPSAQARDRTPPPPPTAPPTGWTTDGWGPPAPAPAQTIDLTDPTGEIDRVDPTGEIILDDGPWSPTMLVVCPDAAPRRWAHAARLTVAALAGTGLFLAGMTWPSMSVERAAQVAEEPPTAVAPADPAPADPAPAAADGRTVEDVLRAYRQQSPPVVLPGEDDVLTATTERVRAPQAESPSAEASGDAEAPIEAAAAEVATAEEPEPPPAPVVAVDPYSAATWDLLATCESTSDWQANTGNGFYGGLQFQLSSWELVGGQGMPHEASREEQIQRAIALWEIQGWGAWPDCSRRLGFR